MTCYYLTKLSLLLLTDIPYSSVISLFYISLTLHFDTFFPYIIPCHTVMKLNHQKTHIASFCGLCKISEMRSWPLDAFIMSPQVPLTSVSL